MLGLQGIAMAFGWGDDAMHDDYDVRREQMMMHLHGKASVRFARGYHVNVQIASAAGSRPGGGKNIEESRHPSP